MSARAVRGQTTNDGTYCDVYAFAATDRAAAESTACQACKDAGAETGFWRPRFEEYVGGSLGRAPKNPNLNFKALSRQNLAK